VAEDELAVAYDPHTGSALSDALVNMRYAFSRAVAEKSEGDVNRTPAKNASLPSERSGLMLFDAQAIERAVRNLQMSRAVPPESMFW
jgi:hypothetical protein